MLLEPKQIEVEGKTFVISKLDCITGRKVIALYPASALPKIGDYNVNEEVMFILMSRVAIPLEKGHLELSTPELVRNHVKDAEMLLKLEAAMMEYNYSFFRDGRISGFFQDIAQKLPASIIKMWTALSAQLSKTGKQP